ncbi:MAG: energy transducer TonB [Scytonema sp. RU_4_4]|nr:energy transducer TonB [Scytonema sp. RU_4_4]
MVPSPAQGQPTTSRKLYRVQPSSKVGGASSLGGPVRLSNRDFGSNNLAALPNSNRLNRATEGIDARQDADMGAYLQQLQEQVKQQWIPGLTQSSQRTVLHFIVSRAGLVSHLRVAQTSGFSATDEAALSAVKRAAPFASFPTAYTENYISIQFTFNINVYGQLELWGNGK